jgi:hypothetical protein
MKNGLYSKNCVTDFPAVTQPTQASLITGTYTGDFRKECCHGIPLSNWMDRSFAPPVLRCYGANDLQIYKINEDLGENCKTIFEMIEEGNKSSIVQFINRGADYFFPENKLKLIYYYVLLKYSRNLKKNIARVNLGTVHKLLDNFKKPKKYFETNEAPIASNIYFFTSDLLAHYYGHDSNFYRANLLHIDRCIGILLEHLSKMNYLQDTAIAITSDHGSFKAQTLGKFGSFFEQAGLNHYHPRKNPAGNLDLAEFGSVGFFNFKGSCDRFTGTRWSFPTLKELQNFGPRRVNLLKRLFKIKGTVLMYYRDEDNTTKKGIIHLKKKDSDSGKIKEGFIEYSGQGKDFKTRYICQDEHDVFGYKNDYLARSLIDHKFHSIEEWLDKTYHIDYPLYPDLLARHFKNPRSSDVIVSNAGKVVFNFEHGKYKNDLLYAHDIGLRSCAIVPLIIGGSKEIPHKEISYCKITDIVPTLLNMLRKKPHKSVIGKNLL